MVCCYHVAGHASLSEGHSPLHAKIGKYIEQEASWLLITFSSAALVQKQITRQSGKLVCGLSVC